VCCLFHKDCHNYFLIILVYDYPKNLTPANLFMVYNGLRVTASRKHTQSCPLIVLSELTQELYLENMFSATKF